MKTSKIKVVNFFANWCVPCVDFDKVISCLKKENRDVVFETCNIEESSDKLLMENVHVVPFLKFYKNEVLVATYSGFEEKEVLQKIIDEIKES